MAAGWMCARLLLRTLCEVDRFERIEPSEAALDRKSTIVTLFFATIRVEVRESNRSAHAPQLSLFVGRTSRGGLQRFVAVPRHVHDARGGMTTELLTESHFRTRIEPREAVSARAVALLFVWAHVPRRRPRRRSETPQRTKVRAAAAWSAAPAWARRSHVPGSRRRRETDRHVRREREPRHGVGRPWL